ncbi:MAG: hypothetical protein IH614_15660 [Desulfuromonadales bacterium]|nr:hypothetical protein [Desulfuromonadales bacterium]
MSFVVRWSLCLALLTVCSHSLAWGKAELHPRLFTRGEYNDNIFLSKDRRGDFVATVEPGISGRYETRSLVLDADYALRFRFYERFDERNETQLKEIQRGLVRAELFSGRPFTLLVTDEYSRVVVDPRQPVAEDNPLVNTSGRNRLDVSPRYRLEGRSWRSDLVYRYERLDYTEPEGDDSQAHIARVESMKKLGPRTELLLDLAGEERRFDFEADDYRRADLTAGLRWQPTNRLTVAGWVGGAWIEPETGSNHRSRLWRLEGRWDLNPGLVGTVSYAEEVALSVEDGLSETRQGDVALNWKGRNTAELRLYSREDDYLEIDRRDRATGLDLRFAAPFGKVWALRLAGRVEQVAFRPLGEDAWRHRLEAAIDYLGRRLTASIGAVRQGEDSDHDRNDYRNAIVYVQAGVRF